MDKHLLGIPPILREGESISTHCLQACQGIAMQDEIERLRLALRHILAHCKSDNPPNAQALILFVNRALEEKE
jgi:hypothetical protein